MKNQNFPVIRLEFTFGFIALLLFLSSAFSYAGSQPGTIKGVMINEATKKPITRAITLIRLSEKGEDSNMLSEEGKKIQDAMNSITFNIDLSGQFKFENINLPGEYRLVINVPGYGYQIIDVPIRITSGANVDLGTIPVVLKTGGQQK